MLKRLFTPRKSLKSIPPLAEGEFYRELSNIKDAYKVKEELGTGAFAVVKKAVDEDGKEWALKLIKIQVFLKNKEQTEREVAILREIHHPGVVRLKEVVKTEKYFCLVLELLSGGELFDQIVKIEHFSEHDAKRITKQVLESVAFLHSKGFVHRDLKPENLIFSDQTAHANLKITDFGFATSFNRSEGLTQSVGTPEYIAPEILNEEPYTEAVDMWSIGVILYNVLSGCPPFSGFDPQDLYEKICAAEYTFPSPIWDSIGPEAKDLISKMLTLDPKKRINALDALRHPWFATSGTVMATASLGGAMANLKKYNASRKLKKGILLIVASNRIKKIVRKKRTLSTFGFEA